MNDNQLKVLSLLAIEKAEGNDVLESEYIKYKLGMSSQQVADAKRFLKKKRRVKGKTGKMILVTKFAYLEIGDKKFKKRVCSHLTKKNGRFFCPIRGNYIDERHYKSMCGCVECVTFVRGEPVIYHRPHCPGWMARHKNGE